MRRFFLLLVVAGCNNSPSQSSPDLAGAADAAVDSAPARLRPSARKDLDAVYIAAKNQIYIYGGDEAPASTAIPAPKQFVDQTWRFDVASSAWARVATPTTPGPRGGYATALDTKRNRMIIFGGRFGTDTSPPLANDTWAFSADSEAWAPLAPGTAPSPRVGHRMVYDPAGDRVLLFGGDTSKIFGNGIVGDLWELKFAGGADGAWSQIAAAGPTPRRDVAMGVDTTHKLAVIFGGATSFSDYLDEVWTFDLSANTWAKLSNAGTAPSKRFAAKMDYDPGHNWFLLFGGHDPAQLGLLNDTYSMQLGTVASSAAFSRRTPGDSAITVSGVDQTSPERREKHALVATGSSLWLFGGASDCGELDDVWTLPFASPTMWTKSQAAMIGETCQRRAQQDSQCQAPPNDCTNPL